MARDLKSLSKSNWNTTENPTNEDIQTSCMMRMADATELMASKYIQMEKDLDFYKKRCEERGDYISSIEKKISNLRGQVTKLKNKLNNR